MNSHIKSTVIDLLYRNYNYNRIHHFWTSQYRHIVLSKCCDIIDECENRVFRACYPIYCKKVEEACKVMIDRVNGKEEEDDEHREWPHNLDWFCCEDYPFSFIDILFRKAREHAPKDGLLVWLDSFITREQPCSSHCIGACGKAGWLSCL